MKLKMIYCTYIYKYLILLVRNELFHLSINLVYIKKTNTFIYC